MSLRLAFVAPLVLLADLGAVRGLPGQASPPAPAPPAPEVRTAATAQRSVRPDLASVTFSFSASGPTPLAAGRAVAARADSLRRALQALGIPRDSLVSGSRWYWWRGRIEMVVGPPRYLPMPRDSVTGATRREVRDTAYRAQDEIEVRIRDLNKVGPAIDTALAHGVTDISSIRFTATDVSAAQEEALREATRSARRHAEAIADAGGGRLGSTLWLGTDPGAPYDRYGSSFELSVTGLTGSGGAGSSGTEVIQPTIPVRVTVYGRWELLGKP